MGIGFVFTFIGIIAFRLRYFQNRRIKGFQVIYSNEMWVQVFENFVLCFRKGWLFLDWKLNTENEK